MLVLVLRVNEGVTFRCGGKECGLTLLSAGVTGLRVAFYSADDIFIRVLLPGQGCKVRLPGLDRRAEFYFDPTRSHIRPSVGIDVDRDVLVLRNSLIDPQRFAVNVFDKICRDDVAVASEVRSLVAQGVA